jgi:hypothetical protein
MGKFFRKIGLLTVAMMMLSGVAYGQDSTPNAKWLLDLPTDNIANIADLVRTTNKVSRHQTVYFPIFQQNGTATTAQTVQDGVLVECDTTADPGCSSASLFIDANGAILCGTPDLGTVLTASGGVLDLWICADSTCTAEAALKYDNVISAITTGTCLNVGGSAFTPSMVGGAWIYLNWETPPDTAGDTPLVWVTGY